MKDRDELQRALGAAPVFDGGRLRATRELIGASQGEIAEQVGITPSALSQLERNVSRPSARTLALLAQILDVSVDAFARRPEPRHDLAPQFRHLRRTSKRDQRKAQRFVEATEAILRVLASRVDLPSPFEFTQSIDPEQPAEVVGAEIERIAAATRTALGVGELEPLHHDLVRLLENGGIVIVRDPETDDDVDAYSAVENGRPIVVLAGGTAFTWDRDNFSLAHELGHLVMHRGTDHRPGTRTVERQAHRFAGAFLAPRDALTEELPDGLDWGAYLEFKLKWGLSMAALAHRAHDLRLIDDVQYARAMRQRSTYGWSRVEPGHDLRPLSRPSLVARAFEAAELSTEEAARLVGLPVSVADRIVGMGPKPVIVA